jgi:hypothetical protein
MIDLVVNQSNRSLPDIHFNATSGNLSISGRCVTENALTLFTPLITWLDEFVANRPSSVTLDINIEYLNSSSVMWMAKIVRNVDALRAQGSSVSITWHYEEDDEDMMDTGLNIKDTFGIDMELIPESAV